MRGEIVASVDTDLWHNGLTYIVVSNIAFIASDK